MTQDNGNPFDDQATRDAARRMVEFLEGELQTLPREHPWRRGYTRQIVSLSARYLVSETV